MYDLETSRIGAPYIYIYDISDLRVNILFLEGVSKITNAALENFTSNVTELAAGTM